MEVTLIDKLREQREKQWTEFIEQRYGDQDFTAWERYQGWLLVALSELCRH